MKNHPGGFQEIQHTADLEIKVNAFSLPDLFWHAARGMYHLAKLTPVENPSESSPRKIELDAHDTESLLISFLNELLFFLEDERLLFPHPSVEIKDGTHLEGKLKGVPVLEQHREIKAVTFHRVNIRQEDGQLTVNIVFDI